MTARTDRQATALRPLALSQGTLSRADGSAQFTFGNVSVLGSVTGPAEVRLRDELVDRATLEINVRPLRGQGGPPIKAAASTLSQLFAPLILLHLYPRALIQHTLQTISSPSTTFTKPFSTDPSLRSDDKGKGKELEAPRGTGVGAGEKAARINAAMMALVDAGVQCRGMLVAVAVAFVPVQDGEADDEEMRLDPTSAEEEEATSTHVFAFSFGQGVGGTEGTCVGVDSVGTFSEDQLFDAQDLAQTACQTILAFIRKSVETKYGVEGAPPPAQVKTAPEVDMHDAEVAEESEDDDRVMIEA
ncbi:Exosome non-catalytic core component involved in 3'-5' RNA processing and degradation [Rhodotorula toruloides ATCC 204091]|uniref:Exosome non-catalytic core component n=1 Tax=Rhodotorula toruloides TaxID=5286 RepID=A0A0K3CL23_RHOTO|nr:Exosome non-catalytic core component involved in 3'-5' RNA processing and degradation [Rhodotorula toruloides ATCC 204091]KAK4329874.1 Exosome complex component RRP46 [Rhodotorula toruloides]PRQ72065.1 exosome non-catalytic core component [Rhodotorula toruloides]